MRAGGRSRVNKLLLKIVCRYTATHTSTSYLLLLIVCAATTGALVEAKQHSIVVEGIPVVFSAAAIIFDRRYHLNSPPNPPLASSLVPRARPTTHRRV